MHGYSFLVLWMELWHRDLFFETRSVFTVIFFISVELRNNWKLKWSKVGNSWSDERSRGTQRVFILFFFYRAIIRRKQIFTKRKGIFCSHGFFQSSLIFQLKFFSAQLFFSCVLYWMIGRSVDVLIALERSLKQLLLSYLSYAKYLLDL